MAERYQINEIFFSVQGEGAFAGTPMVFVRFSGCNLECPWCDTQHQSGRFMADEEILNEVLDAAYVGGWNGAHCPSSLPRPPVCFTGGEPLLQLDEDLVFLLSSMGFPLHIETNGTLGLPPMPSVFHCITIGPKELPGGTKQAEWMFPLAATLELKVVVVGNYVGLMEGWKAYRRFTHHFLQPLTRPDGTTNVDEVLRVLQKWPGWRLSVQLHKILGIR